MRTEERRRIIQLKNFKIHETRQEKFQTHKTWLITWLYMPTPTRGAKKESDKGQKALGIYFRRVAIPVESFPRAFMLFVRIFYCRCARERFEQHSLNWIQQKWKNKFWIFRVHEQTINIEPGMSEKENISRLSSSLPERVGFSWILCLFNIGIVKINRDLPFGEVLSVKLELKKVLEAWLTRDVCFNFKTNPNALLNLTVSYVIQQQSSFNHTHSRRFSFLTTRLVSFSKLLADGSQFERPTPLQASLMLLIYHEHSSLKV